MGWRVKKIAVGEGGSEGEGKVSSGSSVRGGLEILLPSLESP